MDVPLCDQADIETEAGQWAKLWKEGAAYVDPFPGGAVPALAPFTAGAIRAAASSFPAGTGVGCDNVAPRAVARLSDEVLAALGDLFLACESTGDWGR